jgi:hypothetical protein
MVLQTGLEYSSGIFAPIIVIKIDREKIALFIEPHGINSHRKSFPIRGLAAKVP